MKATVALPTWNSSPILWLQLESLCRQETRHAFEVIVMEDPSERFAGKEYVMQYEERMKKAGGVLKYIELPEWIPLGEKWRRIAQESSADIYLLAASDNYSAANRIEYTVNAMSKGADWFDVRTGLFFDIRSMSQGWFNEWDTNITGLFMATRTEYIRNLKGKAPERGIDTWIKKQISIKQRAHAVNMMGVHTDGMNNISHNRAALYSKTRQRSNARYSQEVVHDVQDILPSEVFNRLMQTRKKFLLAKNQ